MPASYIKPFTLATSSPHDKRGERFGKWTRTIEGKSYAVATPTKGNKDSGKDYQEDTFNLNVVQATGVILENGQKWLVGTTTPTTNGQLFELNLLSKDGGWKTTSEDSKLISAELDKWVSDGCNIMLLANGIPTLEVLVELSVGKLWANTLRIPFTEGATSEDVEAAKAVITYQLANEGEIPPQDDEDYIKAFNAGLAMMLFVDRGRDYKRATPHLEIEGEFPEGIKPKVMPPSDINLPGTGSNGKGGYSTTYNGFMPTATRLEDFKNLLANDDLRQIATQHNVEFINLCLSLVGSQPIHTFPLKTFEPETVENEPDDLLVRFAEEYPDMLPKGFNINDVSEPEKLGQLLYGTIGGQASNERAFKLAIKTAGLEPNGNPWKLEGENLDKALELLDKE